MTKDRAHSAWRSAETIKKLSDRVIGIGPFSIGLDGLLTWIPGAGLLYSAGAALFLIWSAIRSGATFSTVARMLGYLGFDTLLSAVSDTALPVLGDIADMFWQGHLMAATALQKDIETRHGVPEGVASILHPPKRRRTGLSLVALLLLGLLGVAVWESDFWSLSHQGWSYALSAARLPIGGFTVALWLILAVGLVLIFLVSALRRTLHRRAVA